MKTLIILDIHNKVAKAQKAIDDHPADARVFTGDIYDDFGDAPEILAEVARWHKEQLKDTKNTFIFGNHDIPYAYPAVRGLRCVHGFEARQLTVNGIITPSDWGKHVLYKWVDGHLLSHAGVHPHFLQGHKKCLLARIKELSDKAMDDLMIGAVNPFIDAGRARGGKQRVGGITWCDWSYEFKPIEGLPQIVGHTPRKEPVNRLGNWNLDTHLNHVAMLEDGKVTVIKL